MKKLLILGFTFLNFIFVTKTVEAEEIPLALNDIQESEIVATSILRPSKIWHIHHVSGGYNPPITIRITRPEYGALYTGTLTLKKGYNSPLTHTYEGYIYNQELGHIPLRNVKNK